MKELLVIGDRVLIKPEEKEERTAVGLYLPQTVKDKEEVLNGYVVKTGPGIPLGTPPTFGEEPWHEEQRKSAQYIPMEAQVGDHALFLRKAAVEIKYEDQKYFIAPQSAILVLVRDRKKPLDDIDSLEI
ncbi:MAG: co-chaperone GroES [Calditrichae bacterium]|nr:co-chaperone GroES [Calditrichia bacterium]